MKSKYDHYFSVQYASKERQEGFLDEYKKMYSWNYKYIYSKIKIKKTNALDIGCGLGQNLYTFKMLGFKNSIGIDVSDDSIDFCREKKFNVKKVSAEEYLKKNKNKFDLITIYHVVEHIDKAKIVNFLSSLYEALTPNGVLVINVPNANNPVTAVHDRYVDLTHEILYTPESLREILLLSGFNSKKIQIKEEVAYTPYSKSLFQMLIKTIALPFITYVVDCIWNVFYISQGANPHKNRPVLLSISRR